MPVTWPPEVAVAVATVPARRAVRDVTLTQWRALGATPIVTEQAADQPIGYAAVARNHAAGLRRVLDTPARWVISSEDDIDIDPRIVGLLPTLCRDEPVTLWIRPRFMPKHTHVTGAVDVLPVIQRSHWWGSQAVLMPRRAVEAVCADPLGVDGWDRHLSHVFLQHRWRLWCTDPCLVEHRRLPRVACPTAPYVRGARYEGPTSWSDLDRDIWRYLPATRSRTRPIDAELIATHFGVSASVVWDALEAMERGGHVLRDVPRHRAPLRDRPTATKWHRCAPLPPSAPHTSSEEQLPLC